MAQKIRLGTRDVVLALAMVTGSMTGALLCIVTIVLGKELLPEWLEGVYMTLGGMIWLGLMAIYFSLCNPGKEKNSVKVRAYWLKALNIELWIAAVFFLGKLLNKLWPSLLPMYAGNRIIRGAVSLLLIFAVVWVSAFLLRRLFRQCGLESRVKGFREILLTVGMLILLSLGVWGLYGGWDWLSGKASPSAAGLLASYIFKACCGYGAVWCLMTVLGGSGKSRQISAGEPESAASEGEAREKISTGEPGQNETPRAHKNAKNVFGTVIPLILTAAFFLFTLDLVGESVEDRAASAVEEAVNAGYARLAEGKLTAAGYYFSLAEARARVLEGLAGEAGVYQPADAWAEYPGDMVIGTLYLSYGGPAEEWEKKIINHVYGREWYPALLRYYKEQESLTEKQEFLRNEILQQCILNEEYSRKDCLFAGDIAENELAVQRRLGEYKEELVVCRVFGLMEQYSTGGGFTEEAAYEALEMAEEYPDNLLLQYIACRVAGSYQEDKAGHYERTVEAAARFDSLYDDGSRDKEQLADAKVFLGDVAAHCYDYDAALAYYEASYGLSGDIEVALSCATVHERRKEYEQCIEMAGQVLQKEPDNAQALYLTAVSSLKTRDLDTALDAAGRLGDLIADKDRAADPREENYLYICAQYLAMNDSSSWTDYSWKVYDSLSEEQIAKAQAHGLLWDYMTAVYECFTRKDYAAAAEAAENILAVREDLAMGWYLRGTVAFSEAFYTKEYEDFKAALGYYEKAEECGGIAPAIYFSIANVYDAMGDYENAWKYAGRVEEMLPYQDHGNDVYGISVHNKNLLGALGSKLGR